MSACRYGILGPLEVRTGDAAVRPPSFVQRLLLAVLLVDADRMVPADRLVEELWGDALPGDPPAALRTQVSRLRRLLGSAGSDLRTEAGGYRLRLRPDDLDATRFQNLLTRAGDRAAEVSLDLLEAALALWRGRALQEFEDRSFAQPYAVRLEEARLLALEHRAKLLLTLGLTDEAVASLEALVAEEPGRERARGLLMEALYRSGRQSDALEVYREWCRHLSDELGLDPSPELRRLERAILEHTLVDPVDVGVQHAAGVPLPISSFVGRSDDVERVGSLLGHARLVTLCGPGGVGKTRLALEVLRKAGTAYAGGVRFCDLLTVRRQTSVVRAIATAVGLSERSAHGIDSQLIEHLGGRRLLLVLDNCEHVVRPTAAIAERIARETPFVVVLATSRVRLGVDGEHVWPVAPLDASGPHAPAVRLFLDRARALEPGFDASESDIPAVASLCARLDGLPLAIELAAARLPGLSLGDLALNLDHWFGMLGEDHRADERHRSLHAVVEWSYEQLGPEDQLVFERLCTFAGSFDLAAARAVAGGDIDEDELTGCVLRLVDRSLVSHRRESAGTRYSLLQTIRTYGLERLEARGAVAAVRDRHAAWAVALAERSASGLAGPDEGRWAQALRSSLPELRRAHEWLVGNDTESSLRLIAALHWFALWHAESEVFRWAEVAAAAAAGVRSPLLPSVLASAAAGAWLRGDLESAQATAHAAFDAARDLDAIAGRRALESLADVAMLTGELERAVRLFTQAYERALVAGSALEAVWDIGSVAVALAYAGRPEEAAQPARQASALAESVGSPSARALVRYFLGEIASVANADEAEDHFTAAVELAESVGSRFIVGLAHVSLASLYARVGDAAAAFRYYERAIPEWRRSSSWSTLWVTLRNLVDVLSLVGFAPDAAVLYGAMRSAQTAPPPYGADERRLAEVEMRLRHQLGDEEFGRHSQSGRFLSVDDVAAAALDAARRARLDCS